MPDEDEEEADKDAAPLSTADTEGCAHGISLPALSVPNRDSDPRPLEEEVTTASRRLSSCSMLDCIGDTWKLAVAGEAAADEGPTTERR